MQQPNLVDDYGGGPSNQDYLRGQEAGWRGDELVTPKSWAYQQGYEVGAAGRDSYEKAMKGLFPDG